MSAVPSTERDLLAEVTVLARAYAESQAFVALLAHEVRIRLKLTERALASPDETGLLLIAGENTRALQELVEGLLELARARPDARSEAGEAMRLVLRDLGDKCRGRHRRRRAADGRDLARSAQDGSAESCHQRSRSRCVDRGGLRPRRRRDLRPRRWAGCPAGRRGEDLRRLLEQVRWSRTGPGTLSRDPAPTPRRAVVGATVDLLLHV